VPNRLIFNWRSSTIACVDKLNHKSYAVDKTADAIYEALKPLLVRGVSRHDKKEVLDKMTDLCNDAFQLCMVLRDSKGQYACEILGGEEVPCFLNKCPELAEPVAVEGGKSNEAGEEIVYTLFGGLVRCLDSAGGIERRVLEKADVILNRR
jgi:hypothetical protein